MNENSFLLFYCISFDYKFYNSCDLLLGVGLHCSFSKTEKRCPDFAKTVPWLREKSGLFVSIFGLNSHLKCSFKSILDTKYLNYPAGSFYCNMKFLSNCLYSKKSRLLRRTPSCVTAYARPWLVLLHLELWLLSLHLLSLFPQI